MNWSKVVNPSSETFLFSYLFSTNAAFSIQDVSKESSADCSAALCGVQPSLNESAKKEEKLLKSLSDI
jgi:hypothetical protein